MDRNRSRFSIHIVAAWLLLGWSLGGQHADTKSRTRIPKVWDEAALKDWVTPVSGLNVRPTHMSEKEYYSMPESILRSYPIYMPGREPKGYWEMLKRVGPETLFKPEDLKTEEAWIATGRLVFEQASLPQMITLDPRVISEMRSREFLQRHHVEPDADGAIPGFRWVPTRKGVGLSRGGSCVGCHSLTRSDGLRISGAPARAEISRAHPFPSSGIRADYLESANHLVRGASPFFMADGNLGGIAMPSQRLAQLSEEIIRAIWAGNLAQDACGQWYLSLKLVGCVLQAGYFDVHFRKRLATPNICSARTKTPAASVYGISRAA
jgi:hypothetical protein